MTTLPREALDDGSAPGTGSNHILQLLRTCSGTLINSFRFGNQAQGFLDSNFQLVLIALCIPAIVQDLDVGFYSHALQAFAVDGAVGYWLSQLDKVSLQSRVN